MISQKLSALLLFLPLIGAATAYAQEATPKTAGPETGAPKTEAPAAQPGPKPLTVVVWGDSIAAGQNGQQWPAIAERQCNLVLNTGRTVRVINAGHSGMPAAVAKNLFAKEILANVPDVVIIQFGLNDLRYDGSRGAKPLSTPAEFGAHLTEMVTRCQNEAHARVILFGNHKTQVNLVLPSGRTYDEARADLTAVAKQVAVQTKVEFHDLSQELKVDGLTWPDFLSEDGVHLSLRGFNAYGRFAANVIAGTVK